MALRVGFKITRFIRLHTPKFQNPEHIKTFCSQNPKLKYANQPIKAASTLTSNRVERKLKIRNNTGQESSIPIPNHINFKFTEQAALTPKQNGLHDTSVITSDIQPVTIRRKFAKSSTQNAITQPLKLPRLANPFPAPVKTLQSDTVSDEEKARQMQEQVKMEARYHLQMHQEKLLQEKLNKMGQEHKIQLNNNKAKHQSELNQQKNFSFQQQQQLNTPVQQPNFRKPKLYAELQQQELSMVNQQELANCPKKHGINTTEQNIDVIKQKRPRTIRCRRRSHTRATRYRQSRRQYSTSVYSSTLNPHVMPLSEQCDLIIKRLKTLYPEYENLKKPVLIPDSPEEKEFHKSILKLIGKLKRYQAKRKSAPFPSYSEVKTFKTRKPKNNNITNKGPTNDIKFSFGSYPRFYSTKNCMENKNKITFALVAPQKIRCPKFKLDGHPTQHISSKKMNPIKQQAPYPAYSEICNHSEDKHTDWKMCPWKGDVSLLSKHYNHNRFYATSAGDSKDPAKQAAKKPPCKNPFPPLPQCDYVKQAEKNAERKKKKHCPKKPKKCNATSTSNGDTIKIISKIKSWLNGYKCDAENITVTRSIKDIDGRETYVIDVNEFQEINEAGTNVAAEKGEITPEIVDIYQNTLNGKIKPFENVMYQPIGCDDTHAPEMTDPVLVQVRNIPDFITQSSSISPKKPKTAENVTKEQIPLEVKTVKVNEIKENIKPQESKIYYYKDNIKLKPLESKLNEVEENVKLKPFKFKSLEYETNIDNLKPTYSTTDTYILRDEQKLNNAEEKVMIKPDRINLITRHLQFTTKNDKINEVKKKFRVQPDDKLAKSTATTEIIKSKDVKLVNENSKIYSKFKEFKLKELRDVPMPEPCPLVTSIPPGLYTSPGCEDIKGGCGKVPKAKCPKKKCRTKKKRKLPSCDDVKNNKNKCMSYSIPGLEDKPQFAINAPKKTYFKKSDKISNFINLSSEDVGVLANQKPTRKEDFEPFKLKPQFWKK